MPTWNDREVELSRFRLPVSGWTVGLRQPSGTEDLLLAEAARTPIGDVALALTLAGRLACGFEGEPIDWRKLSVTDLDAMVLRLRQALIGDRVRADVPCPAPVCGQRIDIEFSVEDFLAHHCPQSEEEAGNGGAVRSADEPGWFSLSDMPEDSDTFATDVAGFAEGSSRAKESYPGGPEPATVAFRLPTADDLLAVVGQPDGEGELTRRCLRPAQVPDRLRQRVEAAMEAMAPSLSSDLEGLCPECGTTVTVQFDARWFCLRELRDRAVFIYQDVDLLARRYHWSETEILSIPQLRRSAYAELARQFGGA